MQYLRPWTLSRYFGIYGTNFRFCFGLTDFSSTLTSADLSVVSSVAVSILPSGFRLVDVAASSSGVSAATVAADLHLDLAALALALVMARFIFARKSTAP